MSVNVLEQIQLDTMLDQITDGFFVLDQEWNFVYVNKTAGSMIFRNPEDLIGKCIWDTFPYDTDSYFYKQYSKSMIEKKPVHFNGYFAPVKKWFHVRVSPCDQGVCVFFQDISIQKNNMLVDYEMNLEKLQLAQDIAELGYWEYDLISQKLFWSKEVYKIWGFMPSQFKVTFQNFLQTVHPEDRCSLLEEVEKSLVSKSYNVEFRIINADGSIRYIHALGKTMNNENGEAVRLFGTSQDVTERKQMEVILRNTEKLSVVGQLAAGIAHEIRNPLTAIMGFSELLKKAIMDTQYKQYINVMQQELKRLEFFSGELLVLAKPHAVHMTCKNVQQILQDVIFLLEIHSLQHHIEIMNEFPSQALSIHCEETQIKQALVNIIKNAIDSMQHGGKIYIKCSKKQGDRISIQIIDEGKGIPESILYKLGEPFFTTKEDGTGLGLLVAKKIIREHHGKLRIKSKVDQGTTVTVELPRCKKK